MNNASFLNFSEHEFRERECQFSPRSMSAMKRCGLTPKDFLFRNEASFAEPGLSRKHQKQRHSHFEKLRQNKIADAVKSRQDIETEGEDDNGTKKVKTKSGSAGPSLDNRSVDAAAVLLRQSEKALETLERRQRQEIEVMLKQELQQHKWVSDKEKLQQQKRERMEEQTRMQHRANIEAQKKKFEMEQKKVEDERLADEERARLAEERFQEKMKELAVAAKEEKNRMKELRRKHQKSMEEREIQRQATQKILDEQQARNDQRRREGETKAEHSRRIIEETRKRDIEERRQKQEAASQRTIQQKAQHAAMLQEQRDKYEEKVRVANERLMMIQTQQRQAERARQRELNEAEAHRQETMKRMLMTHEERRESFTSKIVATEQIISRIKQEREKERAERQELLRLKQVEAKDKIEREYRRQQHNREMLREKVANDMERAAAFRAEQRENLEKARRFTQEASKTNQEISDIRMAIRQQGTLSSRNRARLEELIPGCIASVEETLAQASESRPPTASISTSKLQTGVLPKLTKDLVLDEKEQKDPTITETSTERARTAPPRIGVASVSPPPPPPPIKSIFANRHQPQKQTSRQPSPTTRQYSRVLNNSFDDDAWGGTSYLMEPGPGPGPGPGSSWFGGRGNGGGGGGFAGSSQQPRWHQQLSAGASNGERSRAARRDHEDVRFVTPVGQVRTREQAERLVGEVRDRQNAHLLTVVEEEKNERARAPPTAPSGV